MEAEFKIKREKIELLPDGVNTEVFTPWVGSRLTREVLGIPRNKKVVVYLGTLHSYYGTDLLLKAIRYIIQKTDEVYFLICGGPNVERYRKMAEELEITKFVVFTGRINYERSPEYLKLADIAVAPKLGGTEANGKLVIYMACGLPVVCFDTEVNRRVLGEFGVYAKLGSYISLAEKMLELLNDRSLRESLGVNLRKRVVSEFSINQTIGKLLEIYNTICRL